MLRLLVAVGVGAVPAACQLHQVAARGDVPGVGAEVEGGVGPTRGHVRQAERTATGVAHRGEALHQSAVASQAVVLVCREVCGHGVVGEHGGLVTRGESASVDRLTVESCTGVVRGEQVASDGFVDDARDDHAVDDRGDRHAPEGNSASEVRGSIDGIDVPGRAAVAARAVLLAHDRRPGEVLLDDLPDASLGGPVVLGDDVMDVGLEVDVHVAPKPVEQQGGDVQRGAAARSRWHRVDSDSMGVSSSSWASVGGLHQGEQYTGVVDDDIW